MARKASAIRARLLDAARQRFLREGVDGASLRGIAADAGTNIGMVYYYFKTKDELFEAVIEEAYRKLLDDLRVALAADVPAEQRLTRLLARLARIDARELDVVRVVLREALVSSERLSRLAARFAQGHVPLVLGALADGVAAGRFDARLHPAVMAVSTLALGGIPQIVLRLVTQAGLPFASQLPSPEQAAQALSQVLLFGIAGPALREEAERE